METKCYSLVRGSAIRVTALDKRGRLPDDVIRYAVSRTIARVQIDEVTDGGGSDMLKNEEDERRLLLVSATQTIRNVVSMDFLRVDPGMLNLVSGMPVVKNAAGQITGFDSKTRLPTAAFALEVWTRLAGQRCADGGQQWGYTLFPFLKGGLLDGFTFSNGLVSFRLQKAQTRRYSKWGRGPYDLEGAPGTQPLTPVSGNLGWRQSLVLGAPPEQTDGVEEFRDVIDGGTASMTSNDVLDGQFVVTSPYVADGGVA